MVLWMCFSVIIISGSDFQAAFLYMALFPQQSPHSSENIHQGTRRRKRKCTKAKIRRPNKLLNFPLISLSGWSKMSSTWPSLCASQTSVANLWLTFDSKWRYCFPTTLLHERNEVLTLWMTDGHTVCHLAEWLSRQMDRCMNGFMPRWIHAGLQLQNGSSQRFWLNYSNKQGNQNNAKIWGTEQIIGYCVFGQLDSQNLNVATTEELKG